MQAGAPAYPSDPANGRQALPGTTPTAGSADAIGVAGRSPARQDLINAINGGLPQGFSVAPYAYSASNHNGITGAYMAVVKNGALSPIGPVQVTDTSPTGAITTYTAAQPAAPASGIPAP